MQQRAIVGLGILTVALVIAGCGSDSAPGPMEMDAAEMERWEIALVEWRIEKNEGVMQSAQSPLPENLRAGFEGLDYYFPEESFRYQVPLEEAAGAETVTLATRKGDESTYAVRGTIRFRHGDQDLALTVYGPEGDAEALWVPFYDKTNGETTYAGGRYLDLERQADGTVEVDFNKAYNPFCAYDAETWSCTLPPVENTLPVRVEAGEKLLSGASH